MITIKVGYLVPFMVLKALPDYNSYFCSIIGTDLYSLLPKKHSKKIYKIGETDWAAVFELKPPRIYLSQRSPQYTRKILESKLFHVLAENQINIKRVASINNVFKVAVKCDLMDGKKIHEIINPHQDTIHEYVNGKVYFILYSSIKKDFAVNSLIPAPIDRIRRVIFYEDMNKIEVIVDAGDVGIFLGKHKINVLSAKKLTGADIEIIGR